MTPMDSTTHRATKMKNSKKAFTLIEVILVIAIIMMLGALLLPVFSRAKDKAKYQVGLSNLKQLGLAANLYMADYADVLPSGESKITGFGDPQVPDIKTLIRAYGAHEGIFKDPLDQCSGLANCPSATWYESYGSSYMYFYRSQDGSQTLIERDSRCIVFSDAEAFESERFGVKAVLMDSSAKYFEWDERTKRLECKSFN